MSTLQLGKAKREQVKLKIGIAGPSGSGKTWSALNVAYGLCNDREKIAVIDTENGSASLYSDLGGYNVINLDAPFSPDRYIEAINLCVDAGIEVIIIDSISHEWNGKGGILEMKDQMTGNDFTKRGKLTKIHNRFRDLILSAPCHVICNGRSKTEYTLVEKNGKMVPEKVGMGLVQREGADYEYTVAFDLDIQHNAFASKDRTGIFKGKDLYQLSVDTGKELLARSNQGDKPVEKESSKLNEMKDALQKKFDQGTTKKDLKKIVSDSTKINEKEKAKLLLFVTSL